MQQLQPNKTNSDHLKEIKANYNHVNKLHWCEFGKQLQQNTNKNILYWKLSLNYNYPCG